MICPKIFSSYWHRLKWRWNLSEEMKFWSHWFETKGDEWPEDYARKFNPETEFDQNLRKYLLSGAVDPETHDFSILDVGSGPVTGVGFVWPGYKLKITAVDPLAHRYNELLKRYELTPTIRSRFCHAEALTKIFERNSFDLVHCRNALDHSYDPLIAIREMIAVVKPGGYVLLDHYSNEGVHHNYGGLHKWNFDIQNKRFVLWNRQSKVDLQESFGDAVSIEVYPREQSRIWIFAALKKK